MKYLLLAATLALTSSGLAAQHAHSGHQGHMGQSAGEPGQSQFAAIAEIVAALRADPATDWTRVDIDALRAHLVDMDNVTTRATVATTVAEDAVRFDISGDDATAASIRRMVLAHGPMLQQDTGWTVSAAETATGATLDVRPAAAADLAQIRGLGFFGLLTIGAHHQMHHQMIARGAAPH